MSKNKLIRWQDLRDGDPIYILEYGRYNLKSFTETKFIGAADYGDYWSVCYYVEELANRKDYDGDGLNFQVFNDNITESVAEDYSGQPFKYLFFFSDIQPLIEKLEGEIDNEDVRRLLSIYELALKVKNDKKIKNKKS